LDESRIIQMDLQDGVEVFAAHDAQAEHHVLPHSVEVDGLGNDLHAVGPEEGANVRLCRCAGRWRSRLGGEDRRVCTDEDLAH
jgi:hypothetical protein